MKVVLFSEEPTNIQYMPLPNGEADVWLRKNICAVKDNEGNDMYQADENYFRTTEDEATILENFDEWFDYEMPNEEPQTVEDLLLDMMADFEERICMLEMGVTL